MSAARPQEIALGYEDAGDGDPGAALWIPAGGQHRVRMDRRRAALLRDSLLDLAAAPGVRLVVLGVETGTLHDPRQRAALRARIALLPAGGGLVSHLNGWENISLPLGFHHPDRVDSAARQTTDLLARLGMEPQSLMAKLPEDMTLSEKSYACAVRIMLESPELVVVEDFATASGSLAERDAIAACIAGVFRQACPRVTLVQLDHAPEGGGAAGDRPGSVS